jgi:hypothetical protein
MKEEIMGLNLRFVASCSILFLCAFMLTMTFASGSDLNQKKSGIVSDNHVLVHESYPDDRSEKFSYNKPTEPSIAQVSGELKVEIDDFLVNDDTQGGCGQLFPDIASNRSGNSVVVWVDWRSTFPDVYAQRLNSSGAPVDSCFRVNEVHKSTNAAWVNPRVAMNDSGYFVVTWVGFHESELPIDGDIYAQRYDPTGLPLGSNFKVNDDGVNSVDNRGSSVTINTSGDFVIVWHDDRNTSNDIYAQMYLSNGIPVGPNFLVNDDEGNTYQADPSVTSDGAGNFTITWRDGRNENNDIYFQMYDISGTPIGANFAANDDTLDASQIYPDIAMDLSGNFAVTWQDNRNGNNEMYARRFNSLGTPLGSDFKVSDAAGDSSQYYPVIDMDDSGSFIIAWYDMRDDYDIYAQLYDSSGAPVGATFKVNDDIGEAEQKYCAVDMDGSGNFTVTWYDYRNTELDIYAQRYDSSGSPMDVNYKVVSDDGTTSQTYPAICTNSSGRFIVAWDDYRNLNSDIYAQIYDSLGMAIGNNFKVNEDTGSVNQIMPEIAMDVSGNFAVCWAGYREDIAIRDIYAQMYSSSGTPLGSNFKVNEDYLNGTNSESSIAMDDSGNFVITWADYRHDNWDVYAQRYNSAGTPLGSNFKVNDDLGVEMQWQSSVTMDGSGNFIITWEDERDILLYASDIYVQRYDSAGVPVGVNVRVNSDSLQWNQYEPVIAADNPGNFVIAWNPYSYRGAIDARRFDSSSEPIDTTFRVNDFPDTRTRNWYPEIAMDDLGNFTITWANRQFDDKEVYAQTYLSTGERYGDNYFVPNPQYATFTQSRPFVAANDRNIFFVWQENRRDKGWDIYAKVINGPSVGIEDDYENRVPRSFRLSQNYPNPFNPMTTISFEIPDLGKKVAVELTIYDIRGRVVRHLLAEELPTGNYSVVWDGRDDRKVNVSSGVYIYTLKCEDRTYTRKMVILR